MSAQRNPAAQIFEPIVQEGAEELQRSVLDLLASGLIAGLDISFGPLAMAIAAGKVHELFRLDIRQALFLGSFLYPLGMLFVVLGKSELYEENTLSPVAGLLTGEGTIPKLIKLWVVVLLSNVAGTVAFSFVIAHSTLIFDPYRATYRLMGMDLVGHSFLQVMLSAVFGGWIVALMAWLLKAVKGGTSQILIVYAAAYLLGSLPLYHCIIGSAQVLFALFAGAPITWSQWLTSFLIPAIIGNTLGGVVCVTGLKGFQAKSPE